MLPGGVEKTGHFVQGYLSLVVIFPFAALLNINDVLA